MKLSILLATDAKMIALYAFPVLIFAVTFVIGRFLKKKKEDSEKEQP
jgi:uncharacterized membrane protein YoaK (UPF0700 family)